MGDVRLPTAPSFIGAHDAMTRSMTQAPKICLKAQVQKTCLKAQVQKTCLKN
jgi:hypothetical protein